MLKPNLPQCFNDVKKKCETLRDIACKEIKTLRDIACKEIKTLRDIACKEIKTLIIILIFTFFLILFSLKDASWNFQTILIEFLNKIFSYNMFYSVICTGGIVTIYKLCKNNKKEKYYFISTTFLDRVASILLGILGIVIPSFIYILLFYYWLDSGEFKNNISITKLFLIFLFSFLSLLMMDLIFKYVSETVKIARKSDKSNDCTQVITLLILFFILLFILNCSTKYL